MRVQMHPAPLPALRKIPFTFSLLLFFSLVTQAQNVTGKVTDAQGTPLSGISVVVKGATTGAASNGSGQYSITAGADAVLVFSSIGYIQKEVPVSGRSVVDVSLDADSRNLNEVVVTALGISKQSRGLGYATSSVRPEDLSINRTPNPINALQGKVPGLNVSALGTGPGGSSKIRIRGQSSIGGNNSPLIVINGVPVDNSNFNTNSEPGGNVNGSAVGVKGGGVFSDGGDGLSSINPDDIENMTILRGAAASALYGSRAKDGVIMITTKTRSKTNGIGVAYNLNYTNETPLDYTDYQKVYGQGENGVRPTTPNPTSGQWSFGEKIEPGMTQTLFNTPNLPYVAQGSRIKEFYRNGQNLVNTVTLSTGGDKGGFYLSLVNSDNKGIVPNNRFNRKGINLGFSYNLTEKLSFMGSVNYSKERNTNPPNIGNQDNSIPTTLMALANTLPLSVLNENKYNALGNEYVYSRFTNRTNPYWIMAEQFHNIRRDRLFGNVSVKYNFLPWLFAQVRLGQDYFSRDESVNNFPTGQAARALVPGFANGVFTQESRRFRETNADFLVAANKQFGDFDASLTVGGNQMRKRLDVNNVQVTDFFVRGLYSVQNGRGKDPQYYLNEIGVNSLYGSAELSWNRTLYVTGTLRDDWFSTLSPENRRIAYPSVSGSYVFSEQLKSQKWLNFAKVRIGYAEVGSDGDVGPFAGQLLYSVNANLINNPAGAGVPIATSGNTIPNPDLVLSRTSETEIGLEFKMFNSRVNLDVSAYQKTTKDQIVTVQVSDGSGFTNTKINSGQSRNKGVEALLTLIPIQRKDFTWQFTANTAYNITKVLSIISNTPGERITIGTHVFNGELRHVVGQQMGQLTGYGYATDPAKGNARIFQANGLPLRTSDLVYFGSALPKWTGGFLNTFNYRGIILSVFVDYKLGNKMLSGTNFNAIREGLHQRTLEGRVGGVIGQGVNQAGAPNTVSVPVQTYWEHLRTLQIVESVIYNGGYWKLRQVSLGYDFSKYLPKKLPFKGVRLDLVANNVLIIKKWVENIDPETFGFGSDNQVGLEAPSLPTTRGIGLNLNIKF